jgi:SAM-dependent methyltransferase
MGLIERLRLPETRQIESLDAPSTTELHGRIIQSKPFLKRLYLDFYRDLAARVEGTGGPVVELGSGGGCIKDVIPEAVTSDVMAAPGVDRVFSATEMPFEDASVGAFVMFDVLHHIKQPREFFREAIRCLRPGGKVVMIEPASTVWSRVLYANFHHERFEPGAGWELDQAGALSESNQALAWIIFHRDREIFEQEFPQLDVVDIRLHSPLRYVLSGGLQFRTLVPDCCYPVVKGIEFLLGPLSGLIGMFETIELRRT